MTKRFKLRTVEMESIAEDPNAKGPFSTAKINEKKIN